MKKLIWLGGTDFRFQPCGRKPVGPGPGEVLVGVRAVGICGTDVHIIEGRFQSARPPLVLGHEIAGVVLEIGNHVNHVVPGDRVTVDQVIGCGKCSFCLRGARQFCPGGAELGFTRDGGCQELLLLPEENVYVLPDEVSLEEGAILDMEVWGALRKCGVAAGNTVLVVGHGPAGLVAAQVAGVFGAGQIILSGDTPDRLKAAERLRVADTYVCGTGEALRKEIERKARGGVDVVFECAGTRQSVADSLACAAPGGRVVLYGVQGGTLDGFDVNRIVLNDLVVYGANSDRRGWQAVIRLVASGKIRLAPMITHRFPLEKAPEAYDLVRRRANGVLKAVVTL